MFTFRFSSLAVRTVRSGLVSMTMVVVAAGLANAGSPKFSMGNSGGSNRSLSSGNSGFSLGSKNSFSLGGGSGNRMQLAKPLSLNNQFKTMDFGSGRQYTPTISTKIGGLSNLVNKNNQAVTINRNIGGLADLVKKNDRGITIDRKIPGLADVAKKDTTIRTKIDGLEKLVNKPNLISSEASRRIADAIQDNGKGGGNGGKDDDHNGKGNGKGKGYCHPDWKFNCHKPCPFWYCWNYPKWYPLYRYGCGYWYDVPVVVIREGVDLQLLAVRMLDSGDSDTVGPAFRVWIRNNSPVAIARPFNVVLVAGRAAQATSELPQTGVRVNSILPGQVIPLDIRLPVAANLPGLPMLHVIVDSHREIVEVFEDNNGAVVARADILPVETAAVTTTAPAASAMTVATQP